MKDINVYKLTQESFNKIIDSQIDQTIVDKLKIIENQSFMTKDEFVNKLIDLLGEITALENLEIFLKYSNFELSTYIDDDGSELPPSDIVTINELRSCADLIRLYDNGKGKLEIQPDFQRDIVWDKAAQTRFIDSLTKQLPIPSLCFSLDYKTQKRLVIDGLQRMQSIINFLTKDDWRLSKLEDIDSRISGKKVADIKESNPDIFEIVENVTLPITVLRCDYSKESHNNYLFTIFHRLNSGGKKLNNQEIRNCIYNGVFNEFLKECNKYVKWRILLKLRDDDSYRFRHEEILLRFFAFFDDKEKYTGRLAKFLNLYMLKHKDLNKDSLKIKKQLFESTVDEIFEKISDESSLDVSITVLETLMYGIAKNLTQIQNSTKENVKVRYDLLLRSDPLSEENLMAGLSNKDKVNERLNESESIFAR